MINKVMLVGIVKGIEKGLEGNALMNLEIDNSVVEDKYKKDIVPVVFYGNMAINMLEYIEPEYVVGIQGTLSNTEQGLVIVAEKVSFLKSTAKSE